MPIPTSEEKKRASVSISNVSPDHLCKHAHIRAPMWMLTFEEQGIFHDALRGFDQKVIECVDVIGLDTPLQQRLEGWQLS